LASANIPRNSDSSDDEEARVGEVDEEVEGPGGSQVTQKQHIRDEVTPLLNAPSISTQSGYRGLDACISRESNVSADRSSIRRKSSATLKEPYNYGGRSTYKQTVGSIISLPASLLNAVDRTVVQQHRDIAGHRNTIRALGFRIRWLDRRNGFDYILWHLKLLYVS
jgi:hypothetical protein